MIKIQGTRNNNQTIFNNQLSNAQTFGYLKFE